MKTLRYKNYNCSVRISSFAANKRQNKCISLSDLSDGMPVARCNVYLDGLKPDEVAIDVNNCGSEVILALQKAGIISGTSISDAIKVIPSGYCDYPVYKLIYE
jgi:hypothetical protein